MITLSAAGCQKKSGRHLVHFAGVVTFDGVPLEEGSIHFSSSKTGEAAFTNIGAGGQYSVDFAEAELGEAYDVNISRTIVNGPEVQAADMKPEPPLKAKIPKRYLSRQSSGLSAVVNAAGENKVDFALSSK